LLYPLRGCTTLPPQPQRFAGGIAKHFPVFRPSGLPAAVQNCSRQFCRHARVGRPQATSKLCVSVSTVVHRRLISVFARLSATFSPRCKNRLVSSDNFQQMDIRMSLTKLTSRLCFTTALLFSLSGFSVAAKPLQYEDVFELEFVSDPQPNASGNKIVFVRNWMVKLCRW